MINFYSRVQHEIIFFRGLEWLSTSSSSSNLCPTKWGRLHDLPRGSRHLLLLGCLSIIKSFILSLTKFLWFSSFSFSGCLESVTLLPVLVSYLHGQTILSNFLSFYLCSRLSLVSSFLSYLFLFYH